MTCVRAGCGGTYGPEGFCDECGLRQPAGASAPVSVTAGVAVAPVSVTTSVGAGSAWSGSGSTSVRSGGSRRGQLGAGLVDVPTVPRRDPATVVMDDPKVSESRRFCGACEQPVGRGRDGQPGLDEGFCPHCRARFSFLPRLQPGDLVNGRYAVAGCLAYGGLGWIYLAKDHNIGDDVAERWVVLKGLINTADPDAMAAAVTERRFLVEVDHPNIVQIFDFVSHPDPHDGTPISYIVMEYVGGRSLRDLLLARRGPTGRPDPLPLPQVIAYGLEVLPALGYLHERGLLFCDFKPDNVIHAEEQLKLIDLGAVRRIDDHVSAIYGTPGYQAPEVPEMGPSVASDLYTVGRSMAVLSFDFTGFTTTHADRLPDQADVPLLAGQESYYRWLARVTHPDPARRFRSAAEMAEQLHGVLREVLCAIDGVPRPAPSMLFTPERRVFGTRAGAADGTDTSPGGAIAGAVAGGTAAGAVAGGAVVGAMPAVTSVVGSLPLPTVDPTDAAAGYLATVVAADPGALVAALTAAPARTAEVGFQLVRAHIEGGDVTSARVELDALAADRAGDWRVDWYHGLAALRAGEVGVARGAFDAVYTALPGELAVQLALAVAAEYTGDKEAASALYERVWRTDRGFVSAAFGLARLWCDRGDRHGAVAVLDQVPESSSAHSAAQVAAVRARLGVRPEQLAEPDLLDASERLERLTLDTERQARLSVELIHTSLRWLLASRKPATGLVLGHALGERHLRFGLERSYRTLAKLERDRRTRAVLVDLANAVRPRTLV